MTKSLLALALVMTQLLSWSVAPVYLCLESDGSFGIDAGPESCDCCHPDGALDDHCVDADGDCHHQHGSYGDAGLMAERALCDCLHIQISEQQSPVVLSAAAPSRSSRDVTLFAAPLGCLNSPQSGLDASSRSHGLSPPTAGPQFGRRSVILRC